MPVDHPRPRKAALLAAVLTAAVLTAAPLAAESPAFLAFETYPDNETVQLDPRNIAAIGQRLYFAATDPNHSFGPWISDGTAAGTQSLAQLCLGPCSGASGFTELDGKVVFFSNDRDRGAVYRLDDGAPVQIARPGLAAAWAKNGSKLYFITHELQLFATDGTAEGTRKLHSFATESCVPYSGCAEPEEIFVHGGSLYFTVAGSLYRLTENEQLLPLTPLYGARQFAAVAPGRLVFLGCPGFNEDCGIYTTDGSVAGTREIPGPEGVELPSFWDLHPVVFGGRAYFPIDLGAPFYQAIASTDGTEAQYSLAGFGTAMPDVLGATAAGHLVYHEELGGTRRLVARDAGGQTVVLWSGAARFEKVAEYAGGLIFNFGISDIPSPDQHLLGFTDGTPAGTRQLGELFAEPGGGAIAGHFYFTGSQNGQRGLWRTNGTAIGTAVVRSLVEQPRGGAPRPFRVGSRLVFDFVNQLTFLLPETWRLDPITLAAQQLDSSARVLAAGGGQAYLDSYTGSGYEWTLRATDGASLQELDRRGYYGAGEVAGDGHFFFFTDLTPGQRLWESDGTAGGTRMLTDFAPPGSTCPILCGHEGAIAVSGDHVFHWAQQDGPGLSRLRVWDRTRQESRLLHQSPTGAPIEPIAVAGGRAVFLEQDSPAAGRQRLFVSDGTAAGTRSFFEVPPAYTVADIEAAGPRIFLVLRPKAVSSGEPVAQQLWVSDLTNAGTRALFGAAAFTGLTATGDHLFFAADTGAGQEPGYTDGSSAGTRLFDLEPGYQGSRPRHAFRLDDGRVVFAADTQDHGDEVWISDGTSAGTYRLTDLNPRAADSLPREFAQVGNRLFFQATSGPSGRELWALDLPAALPACPADRLCLLGDRFEVKVTAHAPDGDFEGRRALASAETGVFTFFTPGNWEMMVKVLDGSCGINDHFWVFAAAATDVPYTLEVRDRAAGSEKVYRSAGGPAVPLLDTEAFETCGLDAPEPRHPPLLPPAAAASRCADDPGRFCFGPGGRYRVGVSWRTAEEEGDAHPSPYGTADSGLFTFFSPSNWEMMVKVLDGCAINGKTWVFAAGSTDVGWTLTVSDRESGASRSYENPLGQPSRTVTDVAAFECH